MAANIYFQLINKYNYSSNSINTLLYLDNFFILKMTELRESFGITYVQLPERLNDPTKYNETLRKLCTIQTNENLSEILQRMSPFDNSAPFNINIFKDGVSASWEDEKNANGCSWSIQFKPEYSNAVFERLAIYFCVKGFENFECNGISANIRKHFVKFTVWSAKIPTAIDGSNVLEELRNVFGFEDPIEFIYKNHKDLVEKVVCNCN